MRPCETCGDLYEPQGHKQRFCGRSCRGKARYARHRQDPAWVEKDRARDRARRANPERVEQQREAVRRYLAKGLGKRAVEAAERRAKREDIKDERAARYCAECGTSVNKGRQLCDVCRDARARERRRQYTKHGHGLALKKASKKARKAKVRGAQVAETVVSQKVYERDGYRCHICSKKVASNDLSIDHLVPLSHGGPHTYSNVATAHWLCNVRRGAGRTDAQLLLVG